MSIQSTVAGLFKFQPIAATLHEIITKPDMHVAQCTVHMFWEFQPIAERPERRDLNQ